MQQERSRIVMDTNVVVSAAISSEGHPAKVFELLLSGSVKNFTTPKILEELREVMDRERLQPFLDDELKQFVIKQFCLKSELIHPTQLVNAVPDDIDDNMVIECAVSCNADCIVSGDGHLLKLREYKGISILSPKEFLESISWKEL